MSSETAVKLPLTKFYVIIICVTVAVVLFISRAFNANTPEIFNLWVQVCIFWAWLTYQLAPHYYQNLFRKEQPLRLLKKERREGFSFFLFWLPILNVILMYSLKLIWHVSIQWLQISVTNISVLVLLYLFFRIEKAFTREDAI